jgi:hypothetical protein
MEKKSKDDQSFYAVLAIGPSPNAANYCRASTCLTEKREREEDVKEVVFIAVLAGREMGRGQFQQYLKYVLLCIYSLLVSVPSVVSFRNQRKVKN